MDTPTNNYEIYKIAASRYLRNPEDAMTVYSLFGRVCEIQITQNSASARVADSMEWFLDEDLQNAKERLSEKQNEPLIQAFRFYYALKALLNSNYPRNFAIGSLAQCYFCLIKRISQNSLLDLIVTNNDWLKSSFITVDELKHETFKRQVLLPYFSDSIEDVMELCYLFSYASQIQLPPISEIIRYSQALRRAEGVQYEASVELSQFKLELDKLCSKCIYNPGVECLANLYSRAVGGDIPRNSLMMLMVTRKDDYWYKDAVSLEAAANATIHPKLAHLDPKTIGPNHFMGIDPAKVLDGTISL